MRISFHGAAQEVTGSCHQLMIGDKRLLIDCGLFQGGREIEEDNAGDFGFDPAEIDYLLLTHAHLDHCGRIPLLAKRGFRGEIITTAASRELARLVMLDAAHLQEEDAEWQNRKARRHNRQAQQIEPLYDTLDALNALDYFGRTVRLGERLDLDDYTGVTFLDAGHILGSASILVEAGHGQGKKRILFSGDLGQGNRPILRDPADPPEADIVVMESTYGDRPHKQLEPSIHELYDVIKDTFQRGGNVIIPSFALERSQEILYYLREGVHDGVLPGSMQVFLDSPMAISATEIFRRHPECYNEETAQLFASGRDPFGLPGLHMTRETSESMAINRISGGAVIIAGSGMCTGGRVRHHLKHNLWRRDSSIVFVGYAAVGTLGRRIVDGAKNVRLFGEDLPVHASVYTIGGFSAHADNKRLLQWHQQTGNPETTFLVHGEPEAMQALSRQLHSHKVVMPKENQAFEI